MNTDTGWRQVCSHCIQIRKDHADNKCLYDSGYFEPVPCCICNTTRHSTWSTAIVKNVRYFICQHCARTPTREYYKTHRSANTEFQEFIDVCLSTDELIHAWRESDDY